MNLRDLSIRRRVRKQLWYPAETPLLIQSHIPKTGGKTIRRWLEKETPTWEVRTRENLSDGPPAGPYQMYLGHLRPDFLLRWGIFSSSQIHKSTRLVFIRNPYARIVSLYNHKRRFGYDRLFSEFLEWVAQSWQGGSQTDRKLRMMSRPMSYWVFAPKWPGWTHVFHTERMDEAVVKIQEVLGLTSTPSPIDSWPDYPSNVVGESEKRQIEELYADDFENFSYPKKVPDKYWAG